MYLFFIKIELAKTSIDWGVAVVRIDLTLKDMSSQLKKAFVNKAFNTTVTTTTVKSVSINANGPRVEMPESDDES